MKIPAFELVFYTLSFLIPGFIIRSILERLGPMKRDAEKHDRFLRLLMYGCLNAVALFGVFGTDLVTEEGLRNVLSNRGNLIWWGGLVLGLPVALGLIWAKVRQWNWIYEILNRCGFAVMREEPTAWDYRFHGTDTCQILVTLTEGKQVAGFCGENSYISAAKNGNDLYLETRFEFDENDQGWVSPAQPTGVSINGEEIKYVEFFPKN